MRRFLHRKNLSALLILMSIGLVVGTAQAQVKLTLLTNINVDTEGYDVNDNPYLKFIEKANNVDITIINVTTSSAYNQKVNAVMASGDLPDYLQISYAGRSMLNTFAGDRLIVPLDEYINKTKYLKTAFKDVSWSLSSVDGKRVAVPMERYDPTPYLVYVRKDWLDRLKIDPAGIRTLDDWYKMLVAFRDKDPDGNGKADSVPITAEQSLVTIEMFLDAFGAAEHKVVDGKVLPYYLLPEYKNWLKYMGKLYAEKILDQEFAVNTSKVWQERAQSPQYGVHLPFWSLQAFLPGGHKREELVPIPPPLRLQDGKPGRLLYQSPVRHFMAVTSKCKTPQKVVDLFDWALSDEGGLFVHGGLEGMDYTMVNGKPTVIPARMGKNWAWRFITVGIQKIKMDTQLKDILVQSWGNLGMQQLDLSNQLGMYDNIAMLAPYFKELADFDLVSIVDKFRNSAIMGKVDIDTEWDKYVATWRKSGGDKWIELNTKWYDQSSLKK